MQTRRNLSAIQILTIALTIVIPAGAGGTELKGTPEELRDYLRSETRTVSIRDSAEETAYTDIAKITLIVLTEERDLAASIDENTAVRQRITTRLLDAGISADNIRSSKYSASPQFGWFGRSPNSYQIVNSVLVTVDSEDHFRLVAGLADGEDAVSFGGVEFEHSEKEAFEDQVRDKALTAVLDDAAFFEQRLGLELEPVGFTFTDVRADQPGRYSAAIEEIVVTASRASAARSEPARPPVTFDEVKYEVSVSVTFEVRTQE